MASQPIRHKDSPMELPRPRLPLQRLRRRPRRPAPRQRPRYRDLMTQSSEARPSRRRQPSWPLQMRCRRPLALMANAPPRRERSERQSGPRCGALGRHGGLHQRGPRRARVKIRGLIQRLEGQPACDVSRGQTLGAAMARYRHSTTTTIPRNRQHHHDHHNHNITTTQHHHNHNTTRSTRR